MLTFSEPHAPIANIPTLTKIVLTKYRETMGIQDQIEALMQKQDQLDQEVDEALSLRNELSLGLGNEDDVHDDLLSFLDAHSKHDHTHMQE